MLRLSNWKSKSGICAYWSYDIDDAVRYLSKITMSKYLVNLRSRAIVDDFCPFKCGSTLDLIHEWFMAYFRIRLKNEQCMIKISAITDAIEIELVICFQSLTFPRMYFSVSNVNSRHKVETNKNAYIRLSPRFIVGVFTWTIGRIYRVSHGQLMGADRDHNVMTGTRFNLSCVCLSYTIFYCYLVLYRHIAVIEQLFKRKVG